MRIHWVFRKNADPELITDEDRNDEATQLFGVLIEHCAAFAFQLESAPTTGYLHYQGYFQLVNKKRHTWIQSNMGHFEFIEGMKGKTSQAWAYATKLETRLLGPWEFGEQEELTKKVDTTYKEALEAPTVREGMRIIKENKPRDYCLYGSTIERNLNQAAKKPFTHKYKLCDFNRERLIFDKTSHVYGPSGTGKTSFVVAHFDNPLLVSHIDALKKLTPDHDGIVFDDMSFTHYPTEAVIHLVDQDMDRDIHVRYGTAHIPAGTPKVFTHNTKEIFYKQEANEDQKTAIERRVQYFNVLNKLFVVPADAVVIDPKDNDEGPDMDAVD